MDKQELGDNIRRWRQFRGFKQEQLAKNIAISRGTLSRLENGKGLLSLLIVQQIASALQIHPSQLIPKGFIFDTPPKGIDQIENPHFHRYQ